ncbi:hypothetical protein MAR_014292 [Mya arenaria]|uniref:HTH psq-type domain-containing protein n=1 Tax=Mya arenaria TaxID=6604 RepID=A0ABY7G2B8_MYAAR|nr:hypothetical protein MAR_014292 [Mya arenaria]
MFIFIFVSLLFLCGRRFTFNSINTRHIAHVKQISDCLKMSPPITFCLFVSLLLPASAVTEECPVQQGNDQNTPPLFARGGKPLAIDVRLIVVHNDLKDRCIVNTSQILTNLTRVNQAENTVIYLKCTFPTPIVIRPDLDPELIPEREVYMLQIIGCSFDKSSIFTITSLAEFKTFIFIGSLINGGFTTSRDVRIDSFRSIVSFVYEDIGYSNESIWTLFDEREAFEKMGEISITNSHWLDLPENISSIFPNLQTLDLPTNGLQVPHPIFPWTQDLLYLPNNLTRTGFMHHHYAKSQSLSIPNDIFRRSMDMRENNITDLSIMYYQYKSSYSNDDMDLAVSAVRRKEMKLKDASLQYGVPKSTLHDHVMAKDDRVLGSRGAITTKGLLPTS